MDKTKNGKKNAKEIQLIKRQEFTEKQNLIESQYVEYFLRV